MTIIRRQGARVYDLIEEREKRLVIDWVSLPRIEAGSTRAAVFTELMCEANEHLRLKRSRFQDELQNKFFENCIPLKATYHRAVKTNYVDHPLSAYGSLNAELGGRFSFGKINPQRFQPRPVLYLADNSETAMYEFFQIEKTTLSEQMQLGTSFSTSELIFGGLDESNFSKLKVEVELARVLDIRDLGKLANIVSTLSRAQFSADLKRKLKDHKVQIKALGNHFQLSLLLESPNWRQLPAMYGVPAASQEFANICYGCGVEGLLYRSKKSGGECIAIFTDNLEMGSSLSVDPSVEFFLLNELTYHTRALAKLSSKELRHVAVNKPSQKD